VIVGLLLAAGAAQRFGSQKLVAPFRGAPLVRHAALVLRGVIKPTIAVIGNDAAAVCAALADTGVAVVENPDWRDGLSTSLRRGVASVPAGAEAVVVALGDQPLLDAEVIASLVARWRETGLPIVAARFRGVIAPPVLLARSVFAEVAELRGDFGARPLIMRAPERVAYVEIDRDIPPDVDTPEDLAELSS